MLGGSAEQAQDHDESHADDRDEHRVFGQRLTSPVQDRAAAAGVHDDAPTRVVFGECLLGRTDGEIA
jgi:hypothetical protein